jgi:hypothetical protein
MRSMRFAVVAILMLVVAAPVSAGDVDLRWQLQTPTSIVNDIVLVRLYAASADGETNQSMTGMDVIVQWNPAVLQLLGVQNNGPYPWLQSTFFPDSGLDGLNDTWVDGNAFYTALANFNTPAQATPAGLHVTTFRFRALSNGVSNLQILPSYPQNTQTVVYGGDFVGQHVTGALGNVNVIVGGDMNDDGHVNAKDIDPFLQAVLSSAACGAECPGDFNGNNMIDVGDVEGMVLALLSAP